jgi:hypothetical protein
MNQDIDISVVKENVGVVYVTTKYLLMIENVHVAILDTE